MQWTEQQLKAIKQMGADILVTASAGTGKTAVLSGRCADIIENKSKETNIKNIIVLTFTDAAAEQMKERIAQYLYDAYRKTKNKNLKQQLLLIEGANISTIHAFCKKIITEYFYKPELAIDPTFRVLDEDEQQLLKSEVLQKTIDWAWEQPNLTAGLKALLYKRNHQPSIGFYSNIIKLHNFLDNVVSKEQWLEKAKALILTNPFTNELAQNQKRLIQAKLNEALHQIKHAQTIYQNHNPDGEWNITRYEETVLDLTQTLNKNKWDKSLQKINQFSSPRVSTPDCEDENIAEFLKNTVKAAIDSITALKNLALINPDYLERVNPAVNLQSKTLLELLRKFDKIYQNEKKTINALDFADLEKYALKILTKEVHLNNKIIPSETALEIRKRYKYIFVDEYQDINPPQQQILEAISSENNLFAVGDIKQSIYAFRGAEPNIFLNLLKLASTNHQKNAEKYRFDLNKNFRSQQQILDFVNHIFSRLMTTEFAGIKYDKAATLSPASKAQTRESDSPLVELHILDEHRNEQDNSETKPSSQEKLPISSRQLQAAAIAKKIKQLTGLDGESPTFKIYDEEKNTFRKPDFSDIAILMRAPAQRVNDYAAILRLAGINVTSEFGTDYFQATEINDMVSLLKVLDNPRRDIELAATLRSPIFNISDSELAQIKIHSNTKAKNNQHEDIPFHQAVILYSQAGTDKGLKEKLQQSLNQINLWRTDARQQSVADVIWKIYRRKHYLSFVSALPNGQLRKANLLKLHDRAIQFETFTGSPAMASLARFINFLEKLNESGQQWASAEPQSAIKNAVKITSIHKSKGLEFPIVFVAELNTNLKAGKYPDDCIADLSNTLGLKIIDPHSNAKLESIAYQIISENKNIESLQEELRILYVAATRAKQKLILTAAQKQNQIKNYLCDGYCLEKTLPAYKIKNAKSPLQWLCYAIADQKKMHQLFDTPVKNKIHNEQNLLAVTKYDQKELEKLASFIVKLRNEKILKEPQTTKTAKTKQKSNLLKKIKQNLVWKYQPSENTNLPAKISVTKLTHAQDEFVSTETFSNFKREPIAVADTAGDIQNPTAIGSAYHLVLANLDLANPTDHREIEKTKKKLLKQNAISENIAELIKTELITKFFKSELGQKILKPQNHIFREWPFTYSASPQKLGLTTKSSAEKIIIQGIIDMLVVTPEGIIVVDFKTDSVTDNQANQRAEIYKSQLNLYAEAASGILNKPLKSKFIYFLKPQSFIVIK